VGCVGEEVSSFGRAIGTGAEVCEEEIDVRVGDEGITVVEYFIQPVRLASKRRINRVEDFANGEFVFRMGDLVEN
jgi:hypothetical protein